MLLNLIEHLPRNSHFVAAQAMDIEIARAVAANPPDEKPAPRIADWSPEVEMLAQAVDAVRAMNANQIQIAGGKPKFSAVVRPITALDKAKQELRMAHKALLLDRVEEARRTAREQTPTK